MRESEDFMFCNYAKNLENATRESLASAITWEKCDMLLTLNAESLAKQESIVKSNDSTQEEKDAAQAKIDKLTAEKVMLVKEQSEVTDVYKSVLKAIVGASNEHVSNDETATRNILRLSSCDENSNFFKLAILTQETFASFYDGMVQLHDTCSESIADNGLRTYSDADNKVASELMSNVQKTLRGMLSIPVENDFTKKTVVKINKQDMNTIHECFVSGVSVDITKNRKTGESVSVDGLSFRYAINKRTKKDGTVEYNGVRFKETLAKLAFVKLFK